MNTKICYECGTVGNLSLGFEFSSIHEYNKSFSETDKEFYCPLCKVTYPRSSEKTRTKYVSEDQLKLLIALRRNDTINKLLR